MHGHTLPFTPSPPAFHGIKDTPLRGGPEKVQVLLEEVRTLLSKGAVELVSPQDSHSGWYGNYFLVPKKTGGWRPILNLQPLNQFLRVESFKMETLKNVILAVQPGEWLASIDLQDAYFHVSIRRSHRKFLRFCVQGQCYQYRVLPFGLATSPRIFTKMLAPVIAHIRLQGVHVHPYLDDLLIRAQSPQQLAAAVQITLRFLRSAGFLINESKSQLDPCQDLVYVGGRFCTNLGLAVLPIDRAQALARVAQQFKVGYLFSAQRWLQLLGLCAATIQVLPVARLRMRPIQMYFLSKWSILLPLDHLIVVPLSLLPHLQWWTHLDHLLQGTTLFPPPHSHVVTTDASGSGWGGGYWTMSRSWRDFGRNNIRSFTSTS